MAYEYVNIFFPRKKTTLHGGICATPDPNEILRTFAIAVSDDHVNFLIKVGECDIDGLRVVSSPHF